MLKHPSTPANDSSASHSKTEREESFGTKFWIDITIFWDEIYYDFLTEKKLFWTNKKFVLT